MGYLLQADGRWNRYGEYGCLYTALSQKGATTEYEKMLRQLGISPAEDAERDLVSIDVDVAHVFDLTAPSVINKLGIDWPMITSDSAESIELCRTLADYARAYGNNAIMSPSAAAPGEVNLSIYVDGTASDVNLRDGALRLPLNY